MRLFVIEDEQSLREDITKKNYSVQDMKSMPAAMEKQLQNICLWNIMI